MATTTSALDGLLYIRDGNVSARWNFPDAVGTPVASPGGIGHSVSLSYSFLTATPAYSGVALASVFDQVEKQATRDVLSSISAVAGVRFVEASGVGQMTFAMSSQASGQGGFAYTPGYAYSFSSTIVSVTEQLVAGDVWLNHNASWNAADWLHGHNGYATLLHEVGHALGLKHPFESTSSGYTLVSSLDDESHTVMSYTMAPHSLLITVTGTAASYSWQWESIRPSTLMPLDIEALQYLYGANTATRTGNDVYHWTTNAELLETIWDGGGSDTIDCSNQTLTCIIDLQAGHYSSIAYRQTDAELRQGLDLPSWFTQALPADIYNGSNNLAIAAGTVIEKAIGGAGNDRIDGNDANNTLSGGAGADSLSGGLGRDTIDGGSGIDTMVGGDGNDSYYVRDRGDLVTESSAVASTGGTDIVHSYLSAYTLGNNVESGRIVISVAANLTGNELNNVLYAGRGSNVIAGGAGADTVSYYYGVNGSAGVTVGLGAGEQNTGGSGADTLSGIEHLRGSDYADKLTGNTGANRLEGYAGNDTLDGGDGVDSMIGGDGNDTYYVRDTGDSVSETSATGGTDTVHSYLAAYTLGANVENGRILAAGIARLTGNALNNVLYAGAGNNTMDGSTGTDTASYLYAKSAVTVSLATGLATGGSGMDTLTHIERLTGSRYSDTLTGSGGNNILTGGLGIDVLTGNGGNDTFDFNALTEMGVVTNSATWDVIADFSAGDKIDLSTIDANTSTTTVNDAFSYITGSSFSAAGQLRYDSAAHVLYGNTDGDLLSAEFAVRLTGISSMASANFIA